MPALTDTTDRVAAALDELRATPLVASRLVHEAILPPSPARFEDWPEGLHPELRAALAARGLARAYCHQAEAVATAMAGRDVTVVTPTASGKSLCFVVPVLDAWLRDRTSRSLWLFPTKALAQDQLAALQELSASLPEAPRAAPYDGDTPPGIRRAARQDGHIVVTNPDMLHAGIMPHHTSWVRLFQNLRYIVIDELHAYRGLLGSHLANVLRRLFRLCSFYGSKPVVIACSATIANPRELAERLLERPVVCVDRNGAPRAARRIWFWNPPLHGGVSRRLAVLEARRLMAELLRRELQTIAFARSRAGVELLLSHLRRLVPSDREGRPRVRGYRGGYLPLERRAIEAGLRDGTLRGVVSTNALELGIDIGHLDAAVLVGYPGSIAGSWQQLGRAGRRDTESLGVLIATDNPLDQFLVRHPEYLLQSPPEQGLINPDNLLVLGAHLQAAAFELAFEHGESFGEAGSDRTAGLLESFREDGLVHRSGSRYHWSADAFPAEAISLRRASATNVVIIDTSTGPGGPGQGPQGPWSGSGGGRPGAEGRVVGEVDQFSAPVLVHDDAIYMHDGAQFHVERLDWEEKRAYVHPVSVDHHTLAETRQRLQVLDRHRGPVGAGWQRSLGEVRLSRLATMYKKVRLLTGENVGAGPISLPEQDLHTTACWLALDPAVAGFPSAVECDAGLVAMARLLHSAACLLCMCDPRDLGTHVEPRGQALPGPGAEPPPPLGPEPVPEPLEQAAGRPPAAGGAAPPPEVGRPTVYLYDAVAGGVGIRRALPRGPRRAGGPGPLHPRGLRLRLGLPLLHRARRRRVRRQAGGSGPALAGGGRLDRVPVLGAEAGRAAALGFLPRATASGVAFVRCLSVDLGPHLERAGGVGPAAPDELVRLCLPATAGAAAVPEGPVAVLDIETLGLHGSGVLAFLVGLGSLRGRRLEVEQLLLADPDGEEALLEAVASWVEAHPVVLTYNGRGFDVPALATRCILNRMDPAVMEPRLHADLLGPVRRLFRDRLAACTLRQAELDLLGLERVADVPGSEAPRRYRLWLGGGPASILRGVVRHNQVDLCATAVLGARLAAHVAGDHVLPEHPADRCRLALHHERAGSPEERVDAYLREALAGGRDPWARRAGHRLARRLARRTPPDREEASAVWRRLWEAGPADLVAARALTAALERAGDLEGALEVARHAGRLSCGVPAGRPRPTAAEGWDRRISRLERRLQLRRAHGRDAGSAAGVSLEWASWMSPSRLPTRA